MFMPGRKRVLSWQQNFNTGAISTVMSAVTKEYFFSLKDTFEHMSRILVVSYFLRHGNITSLVCVLVIGTKSMPHREGWFKFLFDS